MDITIQKAKNGEETALVKGHFLHSNYAPAKEAQRFVENLQVPYNPSLIIITEPGLSYVCTFLRTRFQGLKIGAIRYHKGFEAYNNNFDFVLNYFEHPDFEAYLENIFTEDQLLTSFFTPWPASSQIFVDEDKEIWNAIKAAMFRSKTLLITRQYFEKKWFINSCNFLRNIKNEISFDKIIHKDTLIISSGPSLLPFIDLIREYRKSFFIICLSSAISVCLKNEIRPDICMSTDGGYWAGQHLKALYKNKIPLAMSAEAYCPKDLLSKLDILPLDYEEGISSKILSVSKVNSKKAVRNGTVSGTALLFAAAYCDKNIYLSGLDMACQKGYQHAQPNQLEYNACLKDNRLSTKLLRLTKSELTNGSLDIYKDWFINNPLKLGNRKVFRLIENPKNKLGWIKDINKTTFKKSISKNSQNEIFEFTKYKSHTDTSTICKLINENNDSEKWKKQLFPLDYVQLSHNPADSEIKNKINKEWEDIKKEAEKILS